ncbi:MULTISPECIES: N-acetyltransferase [Streptomyces]|uniref:GNAT family N-acetyltransferase n=1 Tax=Streptomyces TaxID=1883 RepID=UPI000BF35243|nr:MULTISPECIES: GNAT family N-acetyltransferase [Streptomyces]PGH47928.1 GNAT family N-acetyltransferase [Streptomyces sp. Ru87]
MLAEVHQHDGYPVNWPGRPRAWLSPASLLAAWVVRLDGRTAGHAGLARSAPGDAAPVLWSARPGAGGDTTAVVNRLFVAPWARGHGIGTALMERVAAEARARGLHPVLDVLDSDTAAAALYERLGWQLLGRVERQWGPRRVTLRCYAAPGPTRRPSCDPPRLSPSR